MAMPVGPFKNFIVPIDTEDDPEKKHKESAPVLRAEFQIPPSVVACYEASQQKNDRREKLKIGMEFLGVALVIITLWATWIAADAAKNSADTAVATLKFTEASAHLDQRAWVGVADFVTPELKAGEKADFGVIITNSGKTPALKVQVQMIGRMLGKDLVFSPSYPLKPPGSSVTILDPGMRACVNDLHLTYRFSQGEVDNMRNGIVVMYLFGKISYEDIFRRPHCRTFCRYLSPDFGAANVCDTYNNEADEACDQENNQ
jgi:hypothetical protein